MASSARRSSARVSPGSIATTCSSATRSASRVAAARGEPGAERPELLRRRSDRAGSRPARAARLVRLAGGERPSQAGAAQDAGEVRVRVVDAGASVQPVARLVVAARTAWPGWRGPARHRGRRARSARPGRAPARPPRPRRSPSRAASARGAPRPDRWAARSARSRGATALISSSRPSQSSSSASAQRACIAAAPPPRASGPEGELGIPEPAQGADQEPACGEPGRVGQRRARPHGSPGREAASGRPSFASHSPRRYATSSSRGHQAASRASRSRAAAYWPSAIRCPAQATPSRTCQPPTSSQPTQPSRIAARPPATPASRRVPHHGSSIISCSSMR